MGRRTLLLIVSILIAAVGTGLIGVYVRGADQRAQSAEKPIQVLVAIRNVEARTSVSQAIEDGSFETQSRPAKLVHAETMFTGSQAVGKLTAKVGSQFATTNILPDQIIQTEMFGGLDQAQSSGLSVGQQALSVELTDSQRVAGLLSPGSQVAIYWTPGGGDSSSGQATGKTKRLLEGAAVTVLAIGDQLVSGSTTGGTGTGGSAATAQGTNQDEVPRTIVSLALDESQVLKVIDAKANGELTFTILPPNGAAG